MISLSWRDAALADPCHDLSAHIPHAGERQVFGFLRRSQEGEPSLFACVLARAGLKKKKKKVIKQTIYQALCVCLSMNIPLLHLLNTHQHKIEERRKKKMFYCLARVMVNDTHVVAHSFNLGCAHKEKRSEKQIKKCHLIRSFALSTNPVFPPSPLLTLRSYYLLRFLFLIILECCHRYEMSIRHWD